MNFNTNLHGRKILNSVRKQDGVSVYVYYYVRFEAIIAVITKSDVFGI
jgi:hypothetical protein